MKFNPGKYNGAWGGKTCFEVTAEFREFPTDLHSLVKIQRLVSPLGSIEFFENISPVGEEIIREERRGGKKECSGGRIFRTGNKGFPCPVRNKDEPVPNIEFVLVIFQENVDMLEKTCLS